MKKLVFLIVILLSASSFAQQPTTSQLEKKLVDTLGEEAQQFFIGLNDNGGNSLAATITKFYKVDNATIRFVRKSESEYVTSENPDFRSKTFLRVLNGFDTPNDGSVTHTNGLRNISTEQANALLTFLEILGRNSITSMDPTYDPLDGASLVFFGDLRAELKLPAFDRNLCVKVLDEGRSQYHSCPPAPSAKDEAKVNRGYQGIRLEKSINH